MLTDVAGRLALLSALEFARRTGGPSAWAPTVGEPSVPEPPADRAPGVTVASSRRRPSVDGYEVYLARINCVLDQASAELDPEDFWELLAQLQYELADRLEPDEDEHDEEE